MFQLLYQFKQYFSWENLLEWSVYVLAIVYIADEFDLPLVSRYVIHKLNGMSGMFQSGDGGSFSIVHTTPEEFENGGFTRKTHQLFSVHTMLRKMHVQGKGDIEVIVKCQGTGKFIVSVYVV